MTSTLDLNRRKKLVKCHSGSTALYGAQTWTLRKAELKYLESFEMCNWRRMEISVTYHVGNEEVLQRVKESNILHTMKRKANWTGHILRRNCFLKHITEGKNEGRTEVPGRRGRKSKKLLDDPKETRGYGKSKEEALDRTLWRTRFGRGYRPVVRQTEKLILILLISHTMMLCKSY
jgi:hypothetical protein